MLKAMSMLALMFSCSVAFAQSPMKGRIQTPYIKSEQQACSDYEVKRILWFNSNVIHDLHEMDMDFNPRGSIDPNVYIEVHAEITRNLFQFQDRYETALKKVIITYPSCMTFVDKEMTDLMSVIHKYPGLENFSTTGIDNN